MTTNTSIVTAIVTKRGRSESSAPSPTSGLQRHMSSVIVLGLAATVALLMAEPAFAQSSGGLDKVNTFMTNVLSILKGVSITTVTIAIIWAGYKFLFKHADIKEVGMILAGGLLIGGAAELASYLLGSS